MAQEIDHSLILRIAEALDRLAPRKAAEPELQGYSAFVWHASPPELEPVPRVNRVDLSLLRGIDLTRDMAPNELAPLAMRSGRSWLARWWV